MLGLNNFQTYWLSRYYAIRSNAIDQNSTNINGFNAGNTHNRDYGLIKENFDPKRYPNIYKNLIKNSHNNNGQKQNQHSEVENSPVAATKMSFSLPQGLHINLQLHIEIFNDQIDVDKDIISSSNVNNFPYNGSNMNRNSCNNNITNDLNIHKGNKGVEIAVAFFLPRGCFIDQHEIEVKRCFEYLYVNIHTYKHK